MYERTRVQTFRLQRRRFSCFCIFIQQRRDCQYTRGMVTLICNSRSPPAISGSTNGWTDETSMYRDRWMINSFRPKLTLVSLSLSLSLSLTLPDSLARGLTVQLNGKHRVGEKTIRMIFLTRLACMLADERYVGNIRIPADA